MGLQMLERETKREKILEARQREIRLKERSRSEQSREEDGGREDGDEGPEQLIARAERDFYSAVELELRRRRDREEQTNRVRTTFLCFLSSEPCWRETRIRLRNRKYIVLVSLN